MSKGPRYVVKQRRRRKGKTDYSKRIKLLKAKKIRFVIRKTNKQIIAQFTEFKQKGDRTLASASSFELKKFGFDSGTKNLPAAYLTGLLAGRRALEKKIHEAILDIGLYYATKGGKIFAVLKGALDAGAKISHDAKVLPSEDRISGKHIKNFSANFLEAKHKILMRGANGKQ